MEKKDTAEKILNTTIKNISRISYKGPKVSIIMATYNRPTYLGEAIESALSQDFEDFELIIINDASTDNETEKVISSYDDHRIFCIKNRHNFGFTKSLNLGLNVAKGHYIAILDDDDVWIDKGKLAKQVEFLDEHPEYILVGTNFIAVDYESEQELNKTNFAIEDCKLRKNIFYNNPIAHSSVMFRKKDALSVGGYDKSLERSQDYDLWLKLGKVGKIGVLPDYSLKHRWRKMSFKQKNIANLRKKDSKTKLTIMWRYRNNYPNIIFPYLYCLWRLLVFMSLEIVLDICSSLKISLTTR